MKTTYKGLPTVLFVFLFVRGFMFMINSWESDIAFRATANSDAVESIREVHATASIIGDVKPVHSTTDSAFFMELREPFIREIIQNGTRLASIDAPDEEYTYSFISDLDSISGSEFSITLTKNIPFYNCKGCFGDWETGVLSPPTHNRKPTELRQFVFQMILTNGENQMIQSNSELKSPIFGRSPVIWKTDRYTWKVSGPEIGGYLIEITSDTNEKWKVYF